MVYGFSFCSFPRNLRIKVVCNFGVAILYKNNPGFVQSVFPRLTLFHQGEQREPQSGGAARIRQKLMFSEIISQAFNQKLTHLQIQSPVPKFDHSCLVRLSLKFILLVD